MKRFKPRVPSPAMAVAGVALFLGLTGTVVAGTKLAKNSVGSQQIRNHSIKGGDLVDDTLTGEQIVESSLGTVPRAATAGTAMAAGVAQTAQTARSADRASSAASADRAGSADRATSAGDSDRLGGRAPSDYAAAQTVFPVAVRLAAGDTRTLVDRDGVKLIARCVSGAATNVGGTADVLTITAESTAEGATLDSPYTKLDGSTGSTLGPATARIALQRSSNTGVAVVKMEDSITLTSVGGTTIFFGSTAGVRLSFGLQGTVCGVTAPVMIASM